MNFGEPELVYHPAQKSHMFPVMTSFSNGAEERLYGKAPATARLEHAGRKYIGWLHFQPIFHQLTAQRPEIFD